MVFDDKFRTLPRKAIPARQNAVSEERERRMSGIGNSISCLLRPETLVLSGVAKAFLSPMVATQIRTVTQW